MANPDNFIPMGLRNQLAADADRADRNGDRRCAAILRRLASYTGADAPRHARNLGAETCTIRYAAARELMRLAMFAEEEARRRPKS